MNWKARGLGGRHQAREDLLVLCADLPVLHRRADLTFHFISGGLAGLRGCLRGGADSGVLHLAAAAADEHEDRNGHGSRDTSHLTILSYDVLGWVRRGSPDHHRDTAVRRRPDQVPDRPAACHRSRAGAVDRRSPGPSCAAGGARRRTGRSSPGADSPGHTQAGSEAKLRARPWPGSRRWRPAAVNAAGTGSTGRRPGI